MQDGTAERRPFERTLADTETCKSGRGTKEVYELLKNDGTRYIYADIDNNETYTSAFGAEEVTHFSTWTPTAGWTYGSSKWTHSAGVTDLVATSETAIVASTKYRVVVGVTFPSIYGTGSNWTYAHTDSGQTWTTTTGNSAVIWLNTWTHAAGSAVALNASEDFDVVAGQSYVVVLYATHTSGTGLSVYLGGDLLGTIASSGYHTFIARYVSGTAGLRLVPSSNWVGSVDKTFPRVASKIDKWCSVVKLITPDAANIPANYDYTEGEHTPESLYLNGAELLYNQPTYWYAEAVSSLSQSVAVSLGGTAAGTITESGVYSYDVTSTNTTALTITPTTSFTGDITSASVMAMTQATAAARCKVIGGTVTGTTDYETTWGNILTDLTTGDTVHPQWATLQDRAFRCDGNNPNYWFEDVTYYHTLGVPSPADAPVTANTTGGELTAGDYNVYYTYVKKYADNYIVEGNPSPVSPVTVSGTAITVAVVACTDLDVTHIRIYRTLYGEQGSAAYRCEEVKNATATVTLSVKDDSIRDNLEELEFNHNVPPLGKFVLGAGSRLWIVDTDGALHWSILDQPELMPSKNMQTFDPKDGDKAMGLCPLRKHVLVFKRRRTWLIDQFSETVSDTGEVALSKDVVSSNIGCIATGSIQPVGTDSAIWLSHAGFILYNGGSIRNISAGDAATGTPSRIQSVINSYLADGAEDFIDSAYHSARQLYHVNLLTRNAAGTTITGQRHFVYNMVSDSWTEYVYRNSSGTKMYETNFAMAHDSLGNEVILIPYIASTTGLITYVYQGEYGEAPTSTVSATEILDSVGADGTALSQPWHACVDASDNVYVASRSAIFKVTSAGAKSCIATNAQLQTVSAGVNIISLSITSDIFVPDLTNDCFYIHCTAWLESSDVASLIAKKASYIIRVGYDGTLTLIKAADYLYCTKTGTYVGGFGIDSDGTNLVYSLDTLVAGVESWSMSKIVNPGAGQTDAAYYTFANATTLTPDETGTYGDGLYMLYRDTTNYTNFQIAKFSDITGTASMTLIDTGITAASKDGNNILVTSDTEIYVYTRDYVVAPINQKLYKLVYSGSTWASTLSLTVSSTSSYGTLIRNTAGDFTICAGNYIYIYDSEFILTSSITISGLTGVYDIARLIGTSDDENTLIACGVTSNNVYKISPTVITLGDDEPTMKNTIAHIVSNYEDLGMSQDKRISRAYLDMDCKYAGCGSFSLEPSYEVNYYTHVNNESAQPDGSVSMRPFYHPGHQTWTYTNDAFDDDVEQWFPMRLDVGIKGNKFRYAIRAGDVATNVTGNMFIRPPRLEVQILGKSGKDD
ncbi:MAG: hypothetical protein PHC68_15060 [Syntrophorhabdaceae bacterium]|nr:hypothetical protein [Patescibacteria group bacterium]MDD5009707.1 hypothetical protein [Syntrophorhabdaceae bacterium]